MSISHDEPKVKLTFREHALFPNDGNRHEIINGRHFMNAAPSPRHQSISSLIQHQLVTQIGLTRKGRVFSAPIDVELTETDVVQPDLVIVLENNPIVTSTRIRGVPDLVVEILSPSNRDYDQELKLRLYDQSQIPEYWIVDPENNSVSRYRLNTDESRYDAPIVETDEIRFPFGDSTAIVDLQLVWSLS